jgi:hypothetical protein
MNLVRNLVPVLLGATLALAPLSSVSARPLGGPGHRSPLVVAADLLNKLKLTTVQKTRIIAVLGQHKNEIVTLGGAKVEARARLDFALERAQIHARVGKVLTPAQRTQLENVRTEMQGMRLERAHAILTLVRELL